MNSAFIRPVVALVLWTFVMWAWMYATRIPAIRKARLKLDPAAPRGEQMATLPPSVRWKADNYNHLFEQPTLFYAIAISLGVLGSQSVLDLGLAWAYVALRVVHSVFQSVVNHIPSRFALFALGSLVLLALSIRAALTVF